MSHPEVVGAQSWLRVFSLVSTVTLWCCHSSSHGGGLQPGPTSEWSISAADAASQGGRMVLGFPRSRGREGQSFLVSVLFVFLLIICNSGCDKPESGRIGVYWAGRHFFGQFEVVISFACSGCQCLLHTLPDWHTVLVKFSHKLFLSEEC